jgi:phosphonate transport system substrate-binding protein
MKSTKIFFLLVIFSNVFLFGASLKIGIFPYTDPLQIIKIHQPLKAFIETKSGEKVEIFSAKSFEEFYDKTKKGHFDIIITPPHLGALHLKDGFNPIYRYNVMLTPFFVVKQNSPLTKITDLKGKKVSLSNYLSVSSISGIIDLQSNKISLSDKNIINTKTHQAAVLSVIMGESDVAITTMTALKQMEKNIDLSQIKYFKGTIKIPHVFTIAHPKMDKKLLVNVKKWFKEFEISPEGKHFLESAGFLGYVEISDDDLLKMEPFSKETLKVINKAR